MDDGRWMASALALARRAVGQTWPNPAVAAVLVRDGIVLGRGVTAYGGRPHAETAALAQANERFGGSSGATAYVTLEPCAHHGQTPPCANALIAAGIRRVVCPLQDPDPRVSGRGFAKLRDGGVKVDVGLMDGAARAVNAGFLSRIERSRPYVVLKLATTLDGRIATRTGESRWITGPEARRRVHMMRAQADAVMIGAGTARADNPMLDVRDLGLTFRSPVRIVLDGSLSVDLTSRLVRSADKFPTIFLHRSSADPARIDALTAAKVETSEVPETGGVLDLHKALRIVAQKIGLTRLLCEGGGSLAAALLSGDLVDELVLFQAGCVIGGDGTPSVRGFGLDALDLAPRLRLVDVEAIGRDTVSIWRR
ncbi:MAG: bifunctional diaminohydroxyphosphoribosylaminopyrimidine deaminase/5-amino-6-(5-phosphoribosylamino)uracil reductase RibD [Paracoccaceae bacterium]